MKNNYCPLPQDDINNLNVPSDLKGLLLSPFQHNLRDGFVIVPEDSFRDFVICTTEYLKIISKNHNIT